MNGAQLHLAVNHLPVVTVLLGTLVLAAALLLRHDGVRQTAYALLAAAGLFAAPAYFSGEPAEEVVEGIPAVQEAVIEEHEQTAEAALVAAGITGVLALGLLVGERRKRLPAALPVVVLLSALGTTGAMGWTAHLGGLIRHPEIASAGAAGASTATGERHDDH